MINSVSPINNNNKISISSPLSVYKQAQNVAQTVSAMVFQSISLLTGSNESGISKQGLSNLRQLLENENLTGGNAYKLVNTMIESFSALSSNGENITQNDFLSVIKFSVAQSFSQSNALSSLIQEGTLNISQDIAAQFGFENAQTLALMEFLDGLSDETVGKISSNINSANSKSTIKTESYYGMDNTRDYDTVASQQLTSPINIAV